MKIIFCLCSLIFILVCPVRSEDSDYGHGMIYECLSARAEGDFRSVFRLAEKIFIDGDNEQKKFVLHLVYEITEIPDIIPDAQACLDKLNISSEDEEIRRLHTIVSMRIASRFGKYSRSDELCEKIGMIRSFNVSSPLTIENGMQIDDICSVLESRKSGTADRINTFNIQTDHEGVFGFEYFYSKCGQKAFLGETTVRTHEDGYYRIYVGRAGKIVLKFDGLKVYSGNNQSQYSPDQVCIKGFVRKGQHSIQMYLAGNETNKLSVSISIVKDDNINRSDRSEWKEIDEVYKDNFIAGFIGFQKGLTGVRNTVKECMDKIKSDDCLYPYACYYSAKAEFDMAQSWKIIEEGTSRYIDPYIAVYRIQKEIDHRNYGNASKICREVNTNFPRSIFTYLCNIQRSVGSVWTEESNKNINLMRINGFPILADQYRVWVSEVCGDTGSLYQEYIRLYESCINGRMILRGLTAEIARAYKHDKWIELHEKAIARDGYGVSDSIAAAGYWSGNKQYDKALPLLSSVLKNAPDNADALYGIARIYFMLKKDDIARYYLSMAFNADPQNELIRRARGFMSPIHDTQVKVPDKELINEGKKLTSNPVVCLGTTTTISIGLNGEFEKKVREEYLINDSSRSDSLVKRSVAIDETLETLTDMRYVSIHSGVFKESRDVNWSSLSDEESKMYYDLIVYDISAPKFQSGDILIFEYSIRSAGTAVKGCYDNRITLGGEFKTLKSRVTLKIRNSAVQWKVYNCTPEISDEKDVDGYRVINMAVSGINPVPDENAIVPIADIIPEIRISSFKSYDDLYLWYYSQLEERKGLSDDLKAAVDTIITGAPDNRDKASKIYRFFTDKIRYTGYENNRGGYIPRKSSETFKSGAGDCKDTALLVTQAMRYAGIKADFALLMTRDKGKIDMSFPSLSAFNHAICRIVLDKPVYLDCTVDGKELDELPEDDRDVSAFVISDSMGYFEKIHGEEYFQKNESIYTEVMVQHDGSIEVDRKVVKTGYSSASTKEEGKSREEDVSAFWQEQYPGSLLSDYAETKTGRTFTTKYTLTINNYVNNSEREILLPAHFLKTAITEYAKAPSRTTSIKISGGQDIVSEIHYKIPEGYSSHILPESVTISFSGIMYKSVYTHNENEIIVSTHLRMKEAEIAVKDYPKLRENIRSIANDQNTIITLIKGE